GAGACPLEPAHGTRRSKETQSLRRFDRGPIARRGRRSAKTHRPLRQINRRSSQAQRSRGHEGLGVVRFASFWVVSARWSLPISSVLFVDYAILLFGHHFGIRAHSRAWKYTTWDIPLSLHD